MNVLENLREFSASSGEWSEMVDLQYRVSDQPDSPDRDAACQRMAVLLESYADRVERSGLVRKLAARSAEDLRAEAAEYRAGRDPHA